MQAIVGSLQSLLFLSFNMLLVDVHPEGPSTVAAAGSLISSGLKWYRGGSSNLSLCLGCGWYYTLRYWSNTGIVHGG
jgi:hypothetical protein